MIKEALPDPGFSYVTDYNSSICLKRQWFCALKQCLFPSCVTLVSVPNEHLSTVTVPAAFVANEVCHWQAVLSSPVCPLLLHFGNPLFITSLHTSAEHLLPAAAVSQMLLRCWSTSWPIGSWHPWSAGGVGMRLFFFFFYQSSIEYMFGDAVIVCPA